MRRRAVAALIGVGLYLALRRKTAPPMAQDYLEPGGEYWFDTNGNIVDRYDPSTEDPIDPVDDDGSAEVPRTEFSELI